MKLDSAIRNKTNLPAEITPIEVMRFMNWGLRDYREAPAKLISTILTYMNRLAASRSEPQFSVPQGPPEAFKRIMRGY